MLLTAAPRDPPHVLLSWRAGQRGLPSIAVSADGRMLFVQTAFPSTVTALDLAVPDHPVAWRASLGEETSAEGLSCCAPPGSPAPAGSRLFVNGPDGHVRALDARTGAQVWDRPLARIDEAELLLGAPLLARGKVFVGTGNDDFGVRGSVAALDLSDGHLLWRRYTTGPDADVGIGAGGGDTGMTSWSGDGWMHGGGGLAGPLVFDPMLDLLFYGTGHPAPWNPALRPGDNRWTSGLFARDPATGAVRWFLGLAPHDLYALGAAGPLILATEQGNRVLLHPDANGFLYTLDAASGRMLSARPFVAQTALRHVDQTTARPDRNPAMALATNTTTRGICPAWPGAVGAEGAALLSGTTLLLIAVNRMCMDFEPRQAGFIAGTPFIGANMRITPPVRGASGRVVAWDLVAGRQAWAVDEAYPLIGGIVVSPEAGVIYGTLDGWLRAIGPDSGRLRWSVDVGAPVPGRPLLFVLPDGRHAVAVASGTSGPVASILAGERDMRDATAGHGYANVLSELKPPADPSGRVTVFVLP
jgi:PQQ-dependent dehydrogenase (methanol/ethanol family)